jgi:hypothetical protein
MSNQGLVKSFNAEAAVPIRRIVKFGTGDRDVLVGAAVGDFLIGISVQPGIAEIGERVDVQMSGIAEVEFGGTVARGAQVTTNATGLAVLAAPTIGVNNRIIGFAMETYASGDHGLVFLAPQEIQGA